MDTQRLILFVIFSFSALFLWERWQSEHRPPVSPPAAQQALPATAVDAPVPAGAMPPPSTLPGAVPGAVRVLPVGRGKGQPGPPPGPGFRGLPGPPRPHNWGAPVMQYSHVPHATAGDAA